MGDGGKSEEVKKGSLYAQVLGVSCTQDLQGCAF